MSEDQSNAEAEYAETERWLLRAALTYINRYPTSRDGLSRVLERKLARRGRAPMLHREIIDKILHKIEAAGLLDDAAFAESRVSAFRRRGLSALAVRARLQEKGIAPELAQSAMEDAGFDEAEAAAAYARRRGLGPYRRIDRAQRRDRDIAAMARAGFPVDLAISIIDAESDQS